jgi:hypothetical protein
LLLKKTFLPKALFSMALFPIVLMQNFAANDLLDSASNEFVSNDSDINSLKD